VQLYYIRLAVLLLQTLLFTNFGVYFLWMATGAWLTRMVSPMTSDGMGQQPYGHTPYDGYG